MFQPNMADCPNAVQIQSLSLKIIEHIAIDIQTVYCNIYSINKY